MASSTPLDTLQAEIEDILTKQNSLHGIVHNVLGGKNLAFEYCRNCKDAAQTLLTKIQEYVEEAFENSEDWYKQKWAKLLKEERQLIVEQAALNERFAQAIKQLEKYERP